MKGGGRKEALWLNKPTPYPTATLGAYNHCQQSHQAQGFPTLCGWVCIEASGSWGVLAAEWPHWMLSDAPPTHLQWPWSTHCGLFLFFPSLLSSHLLPSLPLSFFLSFSLFPFHQLGLENQLKEKNTNKGPSSGKTLITGDSVPAACFLPAVRDSVRLASPSRELPKARFLLPAAALWLGEWGPASPASSA